MACGAETAGWSHAGQPLQICPEALVVSRPRATGDVIASRGRKMAKWQPIAVALRWDVLVIRDLSGSDGAVGTDTRAVIPVILVDCVGISGTAIVYRERRTDPLAVRLELRNQQPPST